VLVDHISCINDAITVSAVFTRSKTASARKPFGVADFGRGAIFPNSYDPLSITPLRFLSSTSHALSEPSEVHEIRNFAPLAVEISSHKQSYYKAAEAARLCKRHSTFTDKRDERIRKLWEALTPVFEGRYSRLMKVSGIYLGK
jgi:hypothetical protein